MGYYSKVMLKIRQWLIKYTDIKSVTNKEIIITALMALAVLIMAAYMLAIFTPANM